jgi:hypothetical protein
MEWSTQWIMRWASVRGESVPFSPRIPYLLLCDVNGNVYMGYRDDYDNLHYYSQDSCLIDLSLIAYWAYVPKPPIKLEPTITDCECMDRTVGSKSAN